MSGIIGKKIGMTSIYDAEGKNIPCTVVEAGPCVVTQIKTIEKDGYKAVQLAFDNAYVETNSSLTPISRLRAHNQYLTMAVDYIIISIVFLISLLIIYNHLSVCRIEHESQKPGENN